MNELYDITTFTDLALYKDLKDSLKDIGVCETALGAGLSEYNGNSFQERLDTNKAIVIKIELELARRYPAFFAYVVKHK